MKQLCLFGVKRNKKDIVYTPTWVVRDIVNWLAPSGTILDPCRGEKAFYNELVNKYSTVDWCEISERKDFFDYHKKVDWIIGNPPYSIFHDWLTHSFNISDNVAYLVPTNKIFQRKVTMRAINNFGGIYGMRIYGSGNNIGFPFGFSVGVFHFKRDFKGKALINFSPCILDKA